LRKTLKKTKFCMYHLQGLCQFGDSCSFAHTCAELQDAPDLRKTRLCKTVATGHCGNPECSFAHTEDELRSTDKFYKKTLCMWHEKGRCRNGDRCRFAHGFNELQAHELNERALASAAQGKGAVPASPWARGDSGAQRRSGKAIPGELPYTDSSVPGNVESLVYATASALSSQPSGVRPTMMTMMATKGVAPFGETQRHDLEPMFVQPLPSEPLTPSSVAGMMPQVAHQQMAVFEHFEQLARVSAQTEQLQRACAYAAAAVPAAGEVDEATELEKLRQNISALSMQLSRFEQQMNTKATGSDPVPPHMEPWRAGIASGVPFPYPLAHTL
jgi:hypothetical protein